MEVRLAFADPDVVGARSPTTAGPGWRCPASSGVADGAVAATGWPAWRSGPPPSGARSGPGPRPDGRLGGRGHAARLQGPQPRHDHPRRAGGRSGAPAQGLPHDPRGRGGHGDRRRGARRADAVRLVELYRPDVVLMDVRMPVLDGIEATRAITGSAAGDGTRVLILTTFDLDEYAFSALRAGASGFLLKDVPPAELVAAIRTVARGRRRGVAPHHPAAARGVRPHAARPRRRRRPGRRRPTAAGRRIRRWPA